MITRSSLAIMIATTALTAWPVLAQTTTGSSPAAPPPPAMTSTPGTHTTGSASSTITSPSRPANPGMASTSAPGTSKYVTADNQIRMSKLVGSSVYNDQNQSVGSIDDVLLNDNDHKAGTVVVSVGGFLGIGNKLVSVPFDQIKVQNDKVVLPGATKASLEGMPEYHYSNA